MAFPSESKQFPLLALRDVVVYPHMVIPLFVGREKSIKALEEAMETDKQIVLVAQVNASDDDPAPSDLYQVGTIATILQLLKLPDGTVKVLVEGANRAFTKNVILDNGYLKAEVRETPLSSVDEREGEVLARSLLSQFEQYVKLSKKVASEILTSVSNIEEPGRLSDTIAAHLALKIQDKQRILEIFDIRERIDHLMALMEGEIDLLQVEKRIRGRVKKQMEKSQREYYLNEQMKAIQKELGDLEEGGNELEEFEKKIESSGMTKEAKEKTKAELNKLKMMSPMSAEATVVRSYLDWMVNLPWKKKSKVRHDLKKAKEILDQDHYGLDEVKERILEYLAVQARVNKSAALYYAWLVLLVWVRPLWASPSPKPPTGNLCAWRWVVFVTKLKFGATAVLISVPCPASWCRRSLKWVLKIHCSCSMRSTKWVWICAAIPLRHCLKCWTRSKTIHLTITTLRWITIFPTYCLSVHQIQ